MVKYTEAELEIIRFDAEDVITASLCNANCTEDF